LARQALAVTPSDQPDRPNIAFSLFDLSVELRVWFGKSNDAAGLDGLSESIDVGRQALAASKRNDPLQVYILSNLGRSLYEWFERTRETASLNEAIGLFRQAIEAANIYEDLIDATDPAAKLAQALWTRFEQMGDAADLHEAIALGRQVVAATPPGDPSLASRQTYLVEALRARFSHAGEQDGLNEAIGLARQALGAISPDHPSFFEDGLNEAIGLARQALGATSPDHPSFIERAASLAKTLRARFERTQDVADLDEAITLFRKGMTIELEEVYTAALFAQLGRSLLMRFQKLGDVRDLDEAVALCQQAVKIVPPEHPERAGCLLDLGETLEARFTRTNSSVDLSNAIMAWKAATGHRTGMTWLRLKAARRWAQLAANIDNFQLATEGYSAALELLPLVAWHGLSQEDREGQLVQQYGLATEAAACAIAAKRPDIAVELLEQGRSVQWSQLLDVRTAITVAHETAPELAARLEELHSILEWDTRAGFDMAHLGNPVTTSAKLVDQRLTLAEEWDTLVNRLRSLPGLQDFLRRPQASHLYEALPGQVIVVNISALRCDALVVGPAGIDIVSLPDLSQASAHERAGQYLKALRIFERNSDDAFAQIIVEQAITATLGWLWDTIAEPVLSYLGHDSPVAKDQQRERVWWCPTGPLTLLPLHAAGYHDPESGTVRTVLDRVISSYTSTLRALGDASTSRGNPGTGQLLVVALAETPNQDELPNVSREIDFLTTRLDETRLLLGASATRQAVSQELIRHAWAHFSCHGRQNIAMASTSGLILHDGVLTVTDIAKASRNRFGHAEFAFLSACKTAVSGLILPDEGINLTAAMQYAGYRQVIGTLWSVWDNSAAEITERVYARLIKGGQFEPSIAAEALHDAVLQLRDLTPNAPSIWASFIHVGL